MDIALAEIAKGLSVFGWAWFSFWTAIPTGLALGLHPIAVIAITSSSYISGIVLVLLPAKSIRDWVNRRYGKNLDESTQDSRLFMRMWRRYGVIGFGLIAPMTVGAQLGVMIGVALNISRRQLLLWMTTGVVAWSVGLTFLAVTGVNLVTTP
jgi:hypothetical protein